MASLTGSTISMASSLKQNKVLTRPNMNSVSLAVNGSSSSLRLRSAPFRFRVSCALFLHFLVGIMLPRKTNDDFKQAKAETVDKVCEIVRKQLALPAESEVSGESKFASLGADSLDTVEIVMGLEEEFGISVEEESAQNIATVQDAANLIEDLIQKKD
ncbi:hypothetical protein LguiA_001145 [Lonicera macranthoides]